MRGPFAPNRAHRTTIIAAAAHVEISPVNKGLRPIRWVDRRGSGCVGARRTRLPRPGRHVREKGRRRSLQRGRLAGFKRSSERTRPRRKGTANTAANAGSRCSCCWRKRMLRRARILRNGEQLERGAHVEARVNAERDKRAQHHPEALQAGAEGGTRGGERRRVAGKAVSKCSKNHCSATSFAAGKGRKGFARSPSHTRTGNPSPPRYAACFGLLMRRCR